MVSSGPHPIRFTRAAIRSAGARTCAGDAAGSWQAVCRGERKLGCDPEHGWIGRIGMLPESAAADLARGWPLAGEVALSACASKGDIAGFAALAGGGAGDPRACAPGAFQQRFAVALGLRSWVGVPVAAACSTGLTGLICAALEIEHGRAATGLVAAADDPLHPLLLAAYRAMGASCGQHLPSAFAAGAAGFAPAQGAAAILLGPGDGPWRLTAGVLAGDAAHETRFHDADAVVATLRALWSVAPAPDAIIAHATGTAAGDAVELAALEAGPWRGAQRIACKPWIGHTLGASGLVELALALHGPWRSLWKISLGFGGHIAAVAVERS